MMGAKKKVATQSLPKWLAAVADVLSREEHVSTNVLDGGLPWFARQYPFLVHPVGSAAASNWLGSAYPSSVLETGVFVGNLRHAISEAVLKNLGITHIVDAAQGCISTEMRDDFQTKLGVRYFVVDVDDVNSAELAPFFSGAHAFIEEAVASGGRVLIHCRAGVSRSATLCLYWLMAPPLLAPGQVRAGAIAPEGRRLGDAFVTLRGCRSIVCPNMGFRKQLLAAEQRLFGATSVSTSLLPGSTPYSEAKERKKRGSSDGTCILS
jgi:hypothetical protein